jgi:hypothetical protein
MAVCGATVPGVHNPVCINEAGHEPGHHFRSPEFDHPFYEVAANIKTFAERGDKCFQKWTCQSCGARQTMTDPNKVFTSGQCEECSQATDIEANGCNFLLVKML